MTVSVANAVPPTVVVAAAAAPVVVDDVPAKFAKLKGLLDNGMITPEEYEEKRKDLLSRL